MIIPNLKAITSINVSRGLLQIRHLRFGLKALEEASIAHHDDERAYRVEQQQIPDETLRALCCGRRNDGWLPNGAVQLACCEET